MPPTAIVTGASPGSIGLETAKALAARGYAVTLACRDPSAAASAVAECALAAAAGGSVRSDALDLADLASVRAFAARYAEASSKLDVLINNAGVMACPLGRTVDGFETQFGTNHLGHYVLTLRLLPLLLVCRGKEAGQTHTPRVVTLAAIAHRFGALDADDPNFQRRRYNRLVAYAQSKLANVLFAAELARRSRGKLISHAVDPGVVATRIVRHVVDPATAPAWQQPVINLVSWFLKTPAQGAATSVYVATSDDDAVVCQNGRYFKEGAAVTASAAARDAATAARLWDVSAQLTGEDGAAGGLLAAE